MHVGRQGFQSNTFCIPVGVKSTAHATANTVHCAGPWLYAALAEKAMGIPAKPCLEMMSARFSSRRRYACEHGHYVHKELQSVWIDGIGYMHRHKALPQAVFTSPKFRLPKQSGLPCMHKLMRDRMLWTNLP